MTEASAACGLIVENAVIVSMDPAAPPSIAGHMMVEADGTIAAVGPGPAPAGRTSDRRLDAGGAWLLPGFVSAHSHLWQSAFAGLASDCNVDGWSNELYALAAALSAQDLFELTFQGGRAHLRNGITSAFNFTFTGGDRSGRTDRAQFHGALQSGLRFIHGLNVGRIGPEWTLAQAEARASRFLDWAEAHRRAGRHLGTMIAGQSVYFDEPTQAHAEGALMRSHGLWNHQHYLESPAVQTEERARYAWMKDAGAVCDRMIFGHFIHTDRGILEDAVAAGARMSWNPLSNGRLGSGTPDIPLYRDNGLRIGLGVDGEASSDRADPFENMRMGLYQVRARCQSAERLSVHEVLHMHTLGAAETLGVSATVGSLQPGKQADFLLINPAAAHRHRDPVGTLVLASGVEHIDAVYVGGERVWDRTGFISDGAATLPEEAPWNFPASPD